jgi:hypothetical protein
MYTQLCKSPQAVGNSPQYPIRKYFAGILGGKSGVFLSNFSMKVLSATQSPTYQDFKTIRGVGSLVSPIHANSLAEVGNGNYRLITSLSSEREREKFRTYAGDLGGLTTVFGRKMGVSR